MIGDQAALLSVLVALVLGWAWRKPLITAVSGIVRRDPRTGQLVIALTPKRKKKKRRK